MSLSNERRIYARERERERERERDNNDNDNKKRGTNEGWSRRVEIRAVNLG